MSTTILSYQRHLFLAIFLTIASSANAQITTSIRGIVVDEQKAALPGATVTATHPSSGLERVATTDAAGVFELPNLPLGAHDVAISLSGFTTYTRRVDAGSVPLRMTATLTLAGFTDTVQVVPTETAIDESSGGTRHAVSVTRIERMPVAVSSRGIEAVLVAFPGFAQNANGAIHPRGAHNQMTFLVDGLPISDQLTGAFANSLDVAVVQTAELLTGNIPAEFGSKVSGVAVLNSRSGRGTGRPLTGSVSVAGGGFKTGQGSLQLGGERGRVGYFGSITAMRTDRFLDQVSLDNLHNDGRFARGFGRVDVAVNDRTQLRTHAMGGGSRFALANQRSQQAAGQDQRQRLDDLSAWTTLTRTIGTSALEATAGYRTTTADLLPSAGDTPVTAAQDRRLSTFTLSTRYHRSRARHQFRAGADLQRFPVAERFSMAITSPAFNVPGSDTFNAALLPYDLTRGGSDFVFDDVQTGSQLSAFVQSTLTLSRWSLNLGLRHDEYRFLVTGRQLQPRVGVAYSLVDDRVVVRASYNRNYQTPPNENLLLSNSEVASRLAPDSVREALGQAYQPIRPERQDVFEAGAQVSLGGALTLDTAVYKKASRDQQDNNNFFDTGIIFPTTLSRIDVTGAEARLTVLPRRGISGSLSATTGRAMSTPPFTGGLFLGQDAVDLLSAGPFLIDHDQRLGLQGNLTIDPDGPWWIGSTVRYDSGLVSNPSDPAEVAADPDYFDLLPFVDLAAETPRVRPRTIVDLAAGIDLKDGRGRKTWSAQVQVTNLTNRTALYNFQSVFVGTRLVAPRSVSIRFARNF